MAWPSGQDVIAGNDPRYTDGNGTEWSADTCPDAGGLDQNIYGFVGS